LLRQSAGQVDTDSEPSQVPLPQDTGQSFGHEAVDSSAEQTPSPQEQSSLQLARVSSGEHRPSPQVGPTPLSPRWPISRPSGTFRSARPHAGTITSKKPVKNAVQSLRTHDP
jgi:hypothetical protein